MIEETVKLHAITPPKYMKINVLASETISLARDCFKLANGYETLTNINLIKCGLYLYSSKLVKYHLNSKDLLTKAYHNYVLFDTQHNQNGIPLQATEILRTLINMNQYLPIRLISAWLDYNLPMLKCKEKLMIYEYMFLVSNSYNRLQLCEKNFSTNFYMKKDKNTGVYEIDTSLGSNPNLDLRLEVCVHKDSKILFDFDRSVLLPAPVLEKVVKKKTRKFSESETTRKFKELLKEPNLIYQVKEALSNSRLLINKSQNSNSRFSYIKYRKTKGVMGSLEASKPSLASNSMTRNHSSAIKSENFSGNLSLTDVLDLKPEGFRTVSRPVSASTVKAKVKSRPRTAKRPITGGSLASTVPVLKEENFNANSLRYAFFEEHLKKNP